jgi:hypothetical protein
MLQLLAHPWPTRQQTLLVLHQVSQDQIYHQARTRSSQFPSHGNFRHSKHFDSEKSFLIEEEMRKVKRKT